MAYKMGRKAYMQEYRRKHPEKLRAQGIAYRQKKREQGLLSAMDKGYNLKYCFGITLEQYYEMYENQHGVCGICQKPETVTNQFGVRLLVVDHDHATGKVRGLLCSHCNSMLGQAYDSPVILEAGIKYLTSNGILAIVS